MIGYLDGRTFGTEPAIDLVTRIIFGLVPIFIVAAILGWYFYTKKKTDNQPVDYYGMASVILALVFSPAGLIVGLIGVKKAKQEGRDPKLSKAGWVLSLAIMCIDIAIVLLLVVAALNLGR